MRPKIRIAIYGLFLRGVCLYVGQTVNPHSRPRQNQRQRGIPRNAKLRILRWTTLRSANKLEREFIAKYKAKGQAKFNKRIMGAITHSSIGRTWLIKVEGIKEPFRGWRDASRRLHRRSCAIHKAAETGEPCNFWLAGLGFRKVKAY